MKKHCKNLIAMHADQVFFAIEQPLVKHSES